MNAAPPGRGRTALTAGGTAVAAVGAVAVLATAVGALLLARAAIRGRLQRDTLAAAEPEEMIQVEPPAELSAARAATVLVALRHVAYWSLRAVAAAASWLARAARPGAP